MDKNTKKIGAELNEARRQLEQLQDRYEQYIDDAHDIKQENLIDDE